jgi:histidine triad (HIT) family protein
VESCAFCELVKDPSGVFVIYEDEDVMAFLNNKPFKPGASIIIPKKHIDDFFDVPDELANKIVSTAQTLSRKIKSQLKPQRVSCLVNGFSVPHAHFRVIPTDDKYDVAYAVLREDLKPLSGAQNQQLQKLLSF